jgi:ADP-heptose:LPS heptosyltransferase
MSRSKTMTRATRLLAELAPRRVAILRALQLGDMLCAVPALRALRTALPQAELVLIGLPWARSFATQFAHLLDDFRVFPGYPGLPERRPDVSSVPAFLTAMQDEHFDLALQLQGSGIITNSLALLFGARATAGCYVPGHFCPDPEWFIPYPEQCHEVHRLLCLLDALGAPSCGDHLEFPIRPVDQAAYAKLAEALGLERGNYVCIHPGARNAARRWPPAQFAQAADALARQGLQIVLTGSAEEVTLTQAVATKMQARAFDVAGCTDIPTMAALMRHARVVLTNNTGVCHLAAALDVPSIALFHHPSEVDRWAPLDAKRHPAVCDISPEALQPVLQHAQDLLREPPPVLLSGVEPSCIPCVS